MLLKFCVLRKINSWLVKVPLYDNLDMFFIDTYKAHDTASVTVTDVTVTH